MCERERELKRGPWVKAVKICRYYVVWIWLFYLNFALRVLMNDITNKQVEHFDSVCILKKVEDTRYVFWKFSSNFFGMS